MLHDCQTNTYQAPFSYILVSEHRPRRESCSAAIHRSSCTGKKHKVSTSRFQSITSTALLQSRHSCTACLPIDLTSACSYAWHGETTYRERSLLGFGKGGRPSNREATYQVARCEWRRKNGAFPCAFAAAGPKNIQELQCSASSSGKHSIGIIMHDLRLIAVISLSIVAWYFSSILSFAFDLC